MASAIKLPPAREDTILLALGNYQLAYLGQDASPVAWAAATGAVALALPNGQTDARVNAAPVNVDAHLTLGGGSILRAAATVPEYAAPRGYVHTGTSYAGTPGGEVAHMRLLMRERDVSRSAAATYFALTAGAAQGYSIFRLRTGDLLVEVGQGAAAQTVIAQFESLFEVFEGAWLLIDAVYTPDYLGSGERVIELFVNGIAPAQATDASVVNDSLPASTTEVTLLTGADGAAGHAEVAFAGFRPGQTMTLAQHRADAEKLGVRANGLATFGSLAPAWDVAWASVDFDKDSGEWWSILPETGVRFGVGTGLSAPGLSTDLLGFEGLHDSLGHAAIALAETAANVTTGGLQAATGLAADFTADAPTGDALAVRVISRVDAGAATRVLWALSDATYEIALQLDAAGDLVATLNGVALGAVSAHLVAEWSMVDVLVQRVAGDLVIAGRRSDGSTFSFSSAGFSHAFSGMQLSVLNNRTQDAPCTDVRLAFIGIAKNLTPSLDTRDLLDSVALGLRRTAITGSR